MIFTKVVLDTRKQKEDAPYPVKIRVTCNRQQKYFLTGYKLTENDFKEIMKHKPAKRWENTRIELDNLELKARSIISKMDTFTFGAFEQRFYQNKAVGQNIYDLYQNVIDEKMASDKIGTAINYRCSMNSLKKFYPKLSFTDITPKFLKEYEQRLLTDNKSISTVGIYIRPLRAIINEAIYKKHLPQDLYPFGRRKYIIPESRNIKKSLVKEDLKKIIQFVSKDEKSYEARARDFWVLSYLCQGMNPKDILLLKKENIENDFIRFVREKTKDTARKGISEIVVPLLPEAKSIIEKWQGIDKNSPYIFDFIKPQMNSLEIYKNVQQFVQMINKHIASIAKKVGITERVTSYSARYSFTKAMIDADVSLEYIRQCLGHRNYSTTQRYVGSFESPKKYDIASKYLLNFN